MISHRDSVTKPDPLSLNPSYPIGPDESQARGENRGYQSKGHDHPEVDTRILRGLKFIGIVRKSSSIVV